MHNPNKKVKIVFACLDWRLHPAIEEYFIKDGAGCDMCVTAGSVKGLIDPVTQNYFLEQIKISQNLHDCQSAVLTMHMDCGAYGGLSAFADQGKELSVYKDELRLAKEIINKNFPGLSVETWVIGLEKSQDGWAINPENFDL